MSQVCPQPPQIHGGGRGHVREGPAGQRLQETLLRSLLHRDLVHRGAGAAHDLDGSEVGTVKSVQCAGVNIVSCRRILSGISHHGHSHEEEQHQEEIEAHYYHH